jgi:NADPH2:quinone reductase
MAAAVVAKDLGLTVLSTTRRPERSAALEAIGVDHAIVDGEISEAVREIVPIARTYALDEISTAHADIEAGNVAGKLVVLP